MSSAINKLLPFDRLNINIFGEMNINNRFIALYCLNFNETKSHIISAGNIISLSNLLLFFFFFGGGGVDGWGAWAYMIAYILLNALNENARLDTLTSKQGFNMLWY